MLLQSPKPEVMVAFGGETADTIELVELEVVEVVELVSAMELELELDVDVELEMEFAAEVDAEVEPFLVFDFEVALGVEVVDEITLADELEEAGMVT